MPGGFAGGREFGGCGDLGKFGGFSGDGAEAHEDV